MRAVTWGLCIPCHRKNQQSGQGPLSSASRLRVVAYGICWHGNAEITSDLQERSVLITTNNAIQQDGHFVLDSFSCVSPVRPSLVCHIIYVSCFVHPADLSRFHQAMLMISSECRLSCDLSKLAHVRPARRTSGWTLSVVRCQWSVASGQLPVVHRPASDPPRLLRLVFCVVPSFLLVPRSLRREQ